MELKSYNKKIEWEGDSFNIWMLCRVVLSIILKKKRWSVLKSSMSQND
jgi:hypothetical protein